MASSNLDTDDSSPSVSSPPAAPLRVADFRRINAAVAKWESNSYATSRAKDVGLHPEVLRVIRAMEGCRLRLQCYIYCLYWYRFLDDYCNVYTTARYREERILWGLDRVNEFGNFGPLRLSDIALLTSALDRARSLGLGDYIHQSQQAYHISSKVEELVLISYMASNEMRFDKMFMSLLEAIAKVEETKRIFPLFYTELEEKRQTIVSCGGLFFNEHDTFVELAILTLIRQLSFACTSEHVDYVCDRYQFCCRFLDVEIFNLVAFITRRLEAVACVHLIASFDGADKETLCNVLKILVESQVKFPELMRLLPAYYYQLFKACRAVQEPALAEAWLKRKSLENATNDEKREVLKLIERTRDCLYTKAPRSSFRIQLNGLKDDIGGVYHLPIPTKGKVNAKTEYPWWVKRFNKPGPSEVKTNLVSVSLPAGGGASTTVCSTQTS